MESAERPKNEADVEWVLDRSPKGAYESYNRFMSQHFTASVPGVEENSPAVPRPFEVDQVRLAPGAKNCPRHAHSLQWEHYIVLSGTGRMLQDASAPALPLKAGDHLLQPPGQIHTMENDGTEDLVYYVIADNPPDQTCYYPDSDKWAAALHVFRMVEAEYYDGEE